METIIREKNTIFKKWVQRVMSSYAPDTAVFLEGTRDIFANPVGHMITESLEGLLDALLAGADNKTLSGHLDPIIRVRAVQPCSPAEAIGFIFMLKPILLNDFGTAIYSCRESTESFVNFLDRLNHAALLSFDTYMNCREQMFSIKSEREKHMYSRALKKAGLIK